MRTISNEQKAKEIAENIVGNDHYSYFDNFKQCALQAMEWKEQQFIERLEDWLANNICNAYNFRGDNISATFMNDCIKAMKGE